HGSLLARPSEGGTEIYLAGSAQSAGAEGYRAREGVFSDEGDHRKIRINPAGICHRFYESRLTLLAAIGAEAADLSARHGDFNPAILRDLLLQLLVELALHFPDF